MREILAFDVEENISARVDLEDLAFSALEYQVSTRPLPPYRQPPPSAPLQADKPHVCMACPPLPCD